MSRPLNHRAAAVAVFVRVKHRPLRRVFYYIDLPMPVMIVGRTIGNFEFMK